MIKNNFKKNIYNMKGSALAIVLIVLMITMVLITGLMAVMTTNQKIGIADKDYAAIYYETEGVLSYELEKIELGVGNIPDKTVNGVETYFADNYPKDESASPAYTNAETDSNKININGATVKVWAEKVEIVQDVSNSSKYTLKYNITSEGNLSLPDNSMATRKAKLYSEMTITVIEGTNSNPMSLSNVPVWMGGNEETDRNLLYIENNNAEIKCNVAVSAEALKEANDNIKGNGNKIYPIDRKNNPNITGKLYTEKGIFWNDLTKDSSHKPFSSSDALTNVDAFVTYGSPTFPETKSAFFEPMQDVTLTASKYKTITDDEEIDIRENNGKIFIDIDNKTVVIKHMTKGKFEYPKIELSNQATLKIIANDDLYIYCDEFNANNNAKLEFAGSGNVYLYVDNYTSNMGEWGKIGRMNTDGLLDTTSNKDVLYINNSNELTLRVKIAANVFVNNNVILDNSGNTISGVLISSKNDSTITIKSGATCGGVYAPNSDVVIENSNGNPVNGPVVCKTLKIVNATIDPSEQNITNTLNILNTLGLSLPSAGTESSVTIDETTKIKRTYEE